VFATVVVTKKSCYQVNDFARIVKKMEENVDDAIVLFQKDFMGKEMTFVILVCEEGKAIFKTEEMQLRRH
jgi:putative heme iron utilization protein